MSAKFYVAKSGMQEVILLIETKDTHYRIYLEEEHGKTTLKFEEEVNWFSGAEKEYICKFDEQAVESIPGFLSEIPNHYLKVFKTKDWPLTMIMYLVVCGTLGVEEVSENSGAIERFCEDRASNRLHELGLCRPSDACSLCRC